METDERDVEILSEDDFRSFCAIILNKLGYGSIEQCEARKGKDFIVHGKDGSIFVECRLKPGGAVGKAIVQALHSEVIAGHAVKGIVMTNGSFTKDAESYVQTQYLPMELIDLNQLKDMAVRAGYDPSGGSAEDQLWVFPLSSKEAIKEKTLAHISIRVKCSPTPIKDLVTIEEISGHVSPVYIASYSIDATFSTSAGVIHHETGSGDVLFNGNTGHMLTGSINDFINRNKPYQLVPFSEVRNSFPSTDLQLFALQMVQINKAAIDAVIARHKKTVRYSGRNNQNYTKECIPSKNDVIIHRIIQAYFPEVDVKFKLVGRERKISFVDIGRPEILVYLDPLSQCDTCHKALRTTGHLCTVCGAIVCEKKGFFSPKGHGGTCIRCGRTVCNKCGSIVPSALIFKKLVCKGCGTKRK